MREVPVPTGFAAQPWKRAITLIAAWLIVLQAFLSGVAAAQAGAMLAADPAGTAVICHGAGGEGTDTPAPGGAVAWHLCCAYCLSSTPAVAPATPPGVAAAALRDGGTLPTLAGFTIVPVRGAIRAGYSQAPPSRA